MKRWLWGAACVGAAAIGYRRWIRPRMFRWGATGADLMKEHPGDDLVPDPSYETTLAVDVEAPPDRVWPWLAQFGSGRGGLYSYDRLDRLFGILKEDSSDRILPSFQALRPGDFIPLGFAEAGRIPVVIAEPGRALVMAKEIPEWNGAVSWALLIEPAGPGRSRLISRNRARIADSLGARLFMAWLEPAAFVMTRKMLLNLKARAERIATVEGAARVTGAAGSARGAIEPMAAHAV